MQTIRDFWCRLMHNDPTWPIRGKYYCRRCWSIHNVPWANTARLDQRRAVFPAELSVTSNGAPWSAGATPTAGLRIPGTHWPGNAGS